MSSGREAILRAAMRIFAEKGYAGASTREICQAAKITKPVLYYYFRDKEHLYQELMIDVFGQYQKKLLELSKKRGTARERLLDIVTSNFHDTRRDPVRFLFLLRMIFAPAQHHPYFNYIQEFENERKVLEGLLRESGAPGQAPGQTRTLATSLMGMQLIAILEHLFTGRPCLTRRRAREFIDILLSPRQCP